MNQRGMVLLVVVVVTAILAVIALGVVRRFDSTIESATSKRQYDVALACADGAREMLLGQFRAFGVVPTDLALDQAVGGKRAASGHYDSFGVRSVEAVDSGQFAQSMDHAMDMANRTVRTRLGSAYYRITVVCSDSASATRQSEVEYLVRFGL